jgi:hypothetical protein
MRNEEEVSLHDPELASVAKMIFSEQKFFLLKHRSNTPPNSKVQFVRLKIP